MLVQQKPVAYDLNITSNLYSEASVSRLKQGEVERLVFLRRCPTRGDLQRLDLLTHLQRNVKGATAILQTEACHSIA